MLVIVNGYGFDVPNKTYLRHYVYKQMTIEQKNKIFGITYCNICNNLIPIKINKYKLEEIQENEYIFVSRGVKQHLCNKKGCRSFELNSQSFEFIQKQNNLTVFGVKEYLKNKACRISEARLKNPKRIEKIKNKEIIFKQKQDKIYKILRKQKDICYFLRRFEKINKTKVAVYIKKYKIDLESLSIKNFSISKCKRSSCKICGQTYINKTNTLFCSDECKHKNLLNFISNRNTENMNTEISKAKARQTNKERYSDEEIKERYNIIHSKARETKIKNGSYITWFENMKNTCIEKYGYIYKEYTQEEKAYLEYKRKVLKITKLNTDINIVRGKQQTDLQLDHIFPVSLGFLYKIPPELIGSEDNIRYIIAMINRNKQSKLLEIPNSIKVYIENNNIKLTVDKHIYIVENKKYKKLPEEYYNNTNVIIEKDTNETN